MVGCDKDESVWVDAVRADSWKYNGEGFSTGEFDAVGGEKVGGQNYDRAKRRKV